MSLRNKARRQHGIAPHGTPYVGAYAGSSNGPHTRVMVWRSHPQPPRSYTLNSSESERESIAKHRACAVDRRLSVEPPVSVFRADSPNLTVRSTRVHAKHNVAHTLQATASSLKDE
jgi:hypothetical protein